MKRSQENFRNQAIRLVKAFRGLAMSKKENLTRTDTVNLIDALCKANDDSRVACFNELLNDACEVRDNRVSVTKTNGGE